MYFEFLVGTGGLIDQANPVPLSTEFIVGGYYAPGDGGGGTFIWIPWAGTIPDDGGIQFAATNDGSGYFQRVFSGPVNVRWFGAITVLPDGSTQNTDVTSYVQAARNSVAFANNGTLYFPKGEYPGNFEFMFEDADHNQIQLMGDGMGSVLKSNGTMTGLDNNPVLRLGYREPNWVWAKVIDLTIDGSYEEPGNRFSYGVWFDNQLPEIPERPGRWVFERVFFVNCDRGVFKPNGNIGNHFIDCYWRSNNYGVYANGMPTAMHFGNDRYSGGCFEGQDIAAIRYADDMAGGGQIIIDGTVIEFNAGWGVTIYCTGDARILHSAVCLRNVWFEGNNYDDPNAGDMKFEGIRSVRIDDSGFYKLKLIDSSVNLYNCRHETGLTPADEDTRITVDSSSSLIAYEQRYSMYPNQNIFVYSISYDISPELGDGGHSPAPWLATSVWGPLRTVRSTKQGLILSEQFDFANEAFDIWNSTTLAFYGSVSFARVLGTGSNRIIMSGQDWNVWSKNVIGVISSPGYCVWSIHSYLEALEGDLTNFIGRIVTDDDANQLGYVYFKHNQWACSYGMKWVNPSDPWNLRLVFTTTSGTEASFYITDYQILMFPDLASANSYVNSRAFAIAQEDSDN